MTLWPPTLLERNRSPSLYSSIHSLSTSKYFFRYSLLQVHVYHPYMHNILIVLYTVPPTSFLRDGGGRGEARKQSMVKRAFCFCGRDVVYLMVHLSGITLNCDTTAVVHFFWLSWNGIITSDFFFNYYFIFIFLAQGVMGLFFRDLPAVGGTDHTISLILSPESWHFRFVKKSAIVGRAPARPLSVRSPPVQQYRLMLHCCLYPCYRAHHACTTIWFHRPCSRWALC